MGVGDEGIYDVVEEQESSCEPIEPIGDIDGIRHRDDDEYEEGDIEDPETHLTEEWEMKSGVSEFHIEPVGSKSCEYSQ